MKGLKFSVILGISFFIATISCKSIMDSIAGGLEKAGHGVVAAETEEAPASITVYRIKPNPNDRDDRHLLGIGTVHLHLNGSQGYDSYDMKFSGDPLGKRLLVTSLGETYQHHYDETNLFPLIQIVNTFPASSGFSIGSDIINHLRQAHSGIIKYTFIDAWWDGSSTNFFTRFTVDQSFSLNQVQQDIIFKFDVKGNLLERQFKPRSYVRPENEHRLAGDDRLDLQNGGVYLDGVLLPEYHTVPNIDYTLTKLKGLVYYAKP